MIRILKGKVQGGMPFRCLCLTDDRSDSEVQDYVVSLQEEVNDLMFEGKGNLYCQESCLRTVSGLSNVIFSAQGGIVGSMY